MEQGERRATDCGVTVERVKDRNGVEWVNLLCGEHGMTLSPFNAWRMFAALAQILGAELPRKLLKTIRM